MKESFNGSHAQDKYYIERKKLFLLIRASLFSFLCVLYGRAV